VVLAKVTLGAGSQLGRVKALEVGPRRSLPTLRDGLTLTRPLAVANPPSVRQVDAAGLQVRPDGGLDVGIWRGSPPTLQPALSIDGATGSVGIGTTAPTTGFTLDVAGGIHARDGIVAERVSAEFLHAGFSVNTVRVFADVIGTDQVILQQKTVPVIRGGRTDPATTPWKQEDVNSVSVVVDTSRASFPGFPTPLYFASLGHQGFVGVFDSHNLVTGINAIYDPTPTSFKLLLRTPTKTASEWGLTTQFVRDRGWFINWIGVVLPD
jgi:hypothetical protein